jgi:hypothetical protein
MKPIFTIASRTRYLLALGAATASLATQAVPVSVSIDGLPQGLAPVLTIERDNCTDGYGFIPNPSQPLTETSRTLIERVVLPSGIVVFRPVVRTRYVATFDTLATPDPSVPLQVPCSAGGSPDLFRFGLKVPGRDTSNQPVVLETTPDQEGFAPQAGPVVYRTTLSARTTDFSPTVDALARGMVHTFTARFESDLGAVESQRIEFVRPSTLHPGAEVVVVRIFVRNDGVGCVQALSTTRCMGGPGLAEAGGVQLRGVQRAVPGQPGFLLPGAVRFQFELLHSFPTGPVKLRAAARMRDLPAYLVNGQPQALNLLPWQGMSQTVVVQ